MRDSLKTTFFHWSSLDCKCGLSLTEPRYEECLISRGLKKQKKY